MPAVPVHDMHARHELEFGTFVDADGSMAEDHRRQQKYKSLIFKRTMVLPRHLLPGAHCYSLSPLAWYLPAFLLTSYSFTLWYVFL